MNSDAGQTTPQNQTYTFSATPGPYPNLTTTVTEPNGDQHRVRVRLRPAGTQDGRQWQHQGRIHQRVRRDGQPGPHRGPGRILGQRSVRHRRQPDLGNRFGGNVSRWTYNGFNQPVTETVSDPEGEHTSTFTYNTLGLRTSMTVPVDATTEATTTFAYGDPDHPTDLTEVVDPDGVTTSSTYDAMGLQTVPHGVGRHAVPQPGVDVQRVRRRAHPHPAAGHVHRHHRDRPVRPGCGGDDDVRGELVPAGDDDRPGEQPGRCPPHDRVRLRRRRAGHSVTDPDGDQTTTSYWLNGCLAPSPGPAAERRRLTTPRWAGSPHEPQRSAGPPARS